MIVISQIAQVPSKPDAKEFVRFMLQSLDKDQDYHMRFLVGCMEHIYRKGDLTDGQKKAIMSIHDDFYRSLRVQFPDFFKDPLPPPPEPEKYTDGNVVFLNKNKAEE